VSKPKTILAWHWTDGTTLRDGTPLVVGKTYRLPKGVRPEMCVEGYHASVKLMDALRYATGSTLSRVRMGGEAVEGDDKLCASERTVLWTVDATRVLRLFACECAERALQRERAAGREPDKRSWASIEVSRRYADGKATEKELDAAWNAAGVAAGDVWDPAWAAAGAAAGDPAWAAARAAAGVAEIAWKERTLVRMVMAERRAKR
jgi:hypothetical protein